MQAKIGKRITVTAILLMGGFHAAAEGAELSTEQMIDQLAPAKQLVTRGIRPVQPGQGSDRAPVTQAAAVPSIDLEVRFQFGSAELTEDAKALLDKLGAAVTDDRLRKFRFRLVGHTDAVGPERYNYELSQQRALAVREYLTQKFRVEPERLESLGRGKAELRDPANPTSGVNRRVQVINIGAAAP